MKAKENRFGDAADDSDFLGLYNSWKNMISRCYNSNDKSYIHYGLRGIGVLPSWRQYRFFRTWALASGWQDKLTIERLDVNGHYVPSNCIWMTKTLQRRNQRVTKLSLRDARDIRMWALSLERYTHKRIAQAYQVSRSVISDIIRKEIWVENNGKNKQSGQGQARGT